ncbi:hypothetical protein [uncultured Hymenobacter sp.]|uniref:hypothetical protein n=1 Tax=uncultured Hymenobacter sp. TaxID=170016 RepID=UPI0035CC4752
MLFPLPAPWLSSRLVLLAGLTLGGPAAAQHDLGAAGAAPFFLSLQIGGGAGMVAVGGGGRLANQRLEPELLVGWVPARFGGQPLTVFTFKTTYLPVRPSLGGRWRAEGGVGACISYTAGATLRDSRDPANYQKGYYWFSTKVRTGLFLTPRLSYAGRRAGPDRHPPRLTAYAEFGSNDLYIISRFSNKGAPSLAELLTLGLGAKGSW